MWILSGQDVSMIIAGELSDMHGEIKENIQARMLGIELIITPGVFSPIYTVTGEFLAKNLILNEGELVLDLGTGTGILAMIAAQKAKKVIATDVNPDAVLCANENIKLNKLENKIEVREGDLFRPVQTEKFDLILWNPPYLKLKSHSILEQSWSCGSNNKLIDRFFEECKEHLNPGGRIEIVYSTLGDVSYLLYKAEKDNSFSVEIVDSMIGRYEIILLLLLKPLEPSEMKEAYMRKKSDLREPPDGESFLHDPIKLENLVEIPDASKFSVETIRSEKNNKKSDPVLIIGGWAIDSFAGSPGAAVFITFDTGQEFRAYYPLKRPDVAAHFNNECLRYSGFAVIIPSGELPPGKRKFRLKIVTHDRAGYYHPCEEFSTE